MNIIINKNKILAGIAIIFCFFLTSCGTNVGGYSEASHILNGNEEYNSIKVWQVKVFVLKPSFSFKIIGTIESRGMAVGNMLDMLTDSGPGEQDDVRLALIALKKEAANMGANGVIITKQGQVRVSSSATERRISGVAIRY